MFFNSRKLKYKHMRDCRWLSPSRATVSDSRQLEYKPGLSSLAWNLKITQKPTIQVIEKLLWAVEEIVWA